jgi:hypothetical protein
LQHARNRSRWINEKIIIQIFCVCTVYDFISRILHYFLKNWINQRERKKSSNRLKNFIEYINTSTKWKWKYGIKNRQIKLKAGKVKLEEGLKFLERVKNWVNLRHCRYILFVMRATWKTQKFKNSCGDIKLIAKRRSIFIETLETASVASSLYLIASDSRTFRRNFIAKLIWQAIEKLARRRPWSQEATNSESIKSQ